VFFVLKIWSSSHTHFPKFLHLPSIQQNCSTGISIRWICFFTLDVNQIHDHVLKSRLYTTLIFADLNNLIGVGFMLLTFRTSYIHVSTSRLSDHLKWRLVATKGGKLCNAITHSVIWTNQMSESAVYCWQRAHAPYDVTCFPGFVGAWNVISSVLSIRKFLTNPRHFVSLLLSQTGTVTPRRTHVTGWVNNVYIVFFNAN